MVAEAVLSTVIVRQPTHLFAAGAARHSMSLGLSLVDSPPPPPPPSQSNPSPNLIHNPNPHPSTFCPFPQISPLDLSPVWEPATSS